MRLFIALEPGDEFLESLLSGLLPLKERYPHLRWVPKENLHVTLAFLGELGEELLPLVKEASQSAAGSGEIMAACEKLFTLPPRRDANILALGFRRGGEEIASLAAMVKKNLRAHSISSGGMEKGNFLPHITLARKGREPIWLLNETPAFSAHGVFRTIKVYQSELLSSGARYTALAAYSLV